MFTRKRETSSGVSSPPTKRLKLEADSTSAPAPEISDFSGQSKRFGAFRDWVSRVKEFATNTLAHSWLGAAVGYSAERMATEPSKGRCKKWKTSINTEKDPLTVTRLPQRQERRMLSLSQPQATVFLSADNPFKDSSTRLILSPSNVKEAGQRFSTSLVAGERPPNLCPIIAPVHASTHKKKNKRRFTAKKFLDTARQAIRLEEKEQYKLLLSQQRKRYEGGMTYTDRYPFFESRAAQTEKIPTSATAFPAAFGRESLSESSKKNMTKWLKASSNIEQETPSSTVVRGEPSLFRGPEVIDSDLEITQIHFPPKKSVSVSLLDSPYFSPQWIQDLKKTLNIDCKENDRRIQEQERKTKIMQEKREMRLATENKKLLERVRLRSVFPESPEASDEEEDASQYPELTPEMESMIEDALQPSPPDEILVEGFRLSVTRRDMETLTGLNWLNDEIIYFYMNLLMERGKMDNFPSVYAFNTFFYPKLVSGGHAALKRWTRKIDIFEYKFILVPVHLGMHWCLAVVDFHQKKIQYYDSMGGQNNECLHALCTYLKEECLDKKRTDYDMNDWKMEAVKNIPHQMNGSDCGMFALKYAEYITRNSKITFTQAHMPYFRRRMVYEILAKRLL